jgi:hypothetical protein
MTDPVYDSTRTLLTGSSPGSQDLIDALGIGPLNIRKIVLTVVAGDEPATLDVTYMLTEAQADNLVDVVKHYQILEIEQ